MGQCADANDLIKKEYKEEEIHMNSVNSQGYIILVNWFMTYKVQQSAIDATKYPITFCTSEEIVQLDSLSWILSMNITDIDFIVHIDLYERGIFDINGMKNSYFI